MQKLGIFVSATLLFSIALGTLALSPEFPVYDVGQRAVVFYEDGVETLVMSSTFAGSADDFAWLIPTPNKPEVDKVSTGLFSELSTRTSRAFKQTGDIYPVPFMVSGLATESFSGPSITVEETKEVGYYEATVVSATDSQELIRWLAERGYTYPSTQGHLLNDYIKDKWHFTVVRIKPDFADSSVSASLRRGHSTPLKLTFNSGEIIYPIKLSQVKIERNASETGVPDFVAGRFGKAAELEPEYYLKGALRDIDISNGSLSLWVKADAGFFSGVSPDLFRIQPTGQSLTTSDSNAEKRLRMAITNGIFGMTINYGGLDIGRWDFRNIPWKYGAWNHVAISWRSNTLPVLYVNNTFQSSGGWITPMRAEYLTIPLADVFIGSHIYGDKSKKNIFGVDELLFNDSLLSVTTIASLFSNAPRHSASTHLLAHFNDNLSYENAENEQAGTFQLLSSGVSKIQPYYDDYNYRYGERFPIVIYTIADHRKKLSGFQTEYAGWITKDDLEKLAEPSGGKTWINPKEKKYFLTKLTSNMERSVIDSDLRITDSPNNKTVNAPNPNAVYWFWIIVALSIAISGGAVFLLIRILRHPRSGA